jgi:hypothetical protein
MLGAFSNGMSFDTRLFRIGIPQETITERRPQAQCR